MGMSPETVINRFVHFHSVVVKMRENARFTPVKSTTLNCVVDIVQCTFMFRSTSNNPVILRTVTDICVRVQWASKK